MFDLGSDFAHSQTKCNGVVKNRESWQAERIQFLAGKEILMSCRQLSQEERYTISGCLRRYESQAELARAMGRSPSTISRELRRNRRPTDVYAVSVAHSYAVARSHRSRHGGQFSDDQWKLVVSLIKIKWSPEQIANRLEANGVLSISHETIYRFLLRDKRKGGRYSRRVRPIPLLADAGRKETR